MLLETDHLDVQRGKHSICQGLSIHLQARQSLCILGPNGAGKTTLLHTLAGLYPSAPQRIKLAGQALAHWKGKALARQRAVLLQNENFDFPATVWEVVLSARYPYLGLLGLEGADDYRIVRQALRSLKLYHLAQRPVNTLSGGERQRLAIACLLAQEPRIAFLDEPNNHLDPGQSIRLLQRLHTHFTQPGHAMIMVLHDVNLAVRFAHRLLLLKGNGQWRFGPVSQLARERHLQWLYDQPVEVLQKGPHRCFYFCP